jgi:NADH-quinone oxidoreductase subunit L
VYMIARCSTVFVSNGAAMTTVAAIGLFTAILAATIALRQFDLKKVFAYSTVSQLGFMFVGVGLLAPVAGVFHLVTHAFFKALLFLSSGVVMHAMAGELDMRKMSGLKRVLPTTRWLMLIGCLALSGVIPLSGFWSKDEIVVAAFNAGAWIGWILLFTAFLTAYYTFRLYFRVFEGPLVLPPDVEPHDASHGAADHGHGAASHADDAHGHDHNHGNGHHDHEPPVMIYPLIVLAVGALLVGFLNTPAWHGLGNFLGASPSFKLGYDAAAKHQGTLPVAHLDSLAFGQHVEGAHGGVHWGPMLLSILVAGAGIGLAYLMHLKDRRRAERLAGQMPMVTRVLEAKYWLDELYAAFIVEPLAALGRLFYLADRVIIDGLVWPRLHAGLRRRYAPRHRHHPDDHFPMRFDA